MNFVPRLRKPVETFVPDRNAKACAPSLKSSGTVSLPDKITVTVSCTEAEGFFVGQALKIELSFDEGASWEIVYESRIDCKVSSRMVTIKNERFESDKEYWLRAFQKGSYDDDWVGPGEALVCRTGPAVTRAAILNKGRWKESEEERNNVNLVEEFDKMVQELKACPGLKVFGYTKGQSLQDQEVQTILSKVGYELDDSIISFFKASNGLRLAWTTTEKYEAGKEEFERWAASGSFSLEGDVLGSIQIPPLESVVSEQEKHSFFLADFMKEETTRFDGVTHNMYEWRSQLRLIDSFHHFYNFAWLLDGSPVPKIFFTSSYGASVNETMVTDLYSYLIFCVATKCSVERRMLFRRTYGGKHPITVKFTQSFLEQFYPEPDLKMICDRGEDRVHFSESIEEH